MVPAHVVVLESVPLGRTGKVDRRALPAPDWREGAGAREAAEHPRGALEQLVAGAFGDLLGVEDVGAEDDFFELGGHSLLAAQALARVSTALGVELPLRALFEAPTPRALAQRAAEARGGGAPEPFPAPLEGPREGPLSFAQQRMGFLQRLAPESPFYAVPLALSLEGALDVAALLGALEDFVARHEPLRTRLVVDGGAPRQAVDPPGAVQVAWRDLASLDAAQRDAALGELLRELAGSLFDLSGGPPFTATLVRLGAKEHVLALCFHHAVTDGWSLDVLLRELSELYAARVEERAPRLAPLPVQYLLLGWPPPQPSPD